MKKTNRREFIERTAGLLAVIGGFSMLGCRGVTKGRVMGSTEADRVGSTGMGAEATEPLIHGAVCQLLGQVEMSPFQQASYQQQYGQIPVRKICFVGIENKSAEELTDTKEFFQNVLITQLVSYPGFEMLSMPIVEAGLRTARCRPSELVVPANRRNFMKVMESNGNLFDYILFANLSSQTTQDNIDTQRDYLLTLELVDIQSFSLVARSSQKLRKEYNRSAKSKVSGWFKK